MRYIFRIILRHRKNIRDKIHIAGIAAVFSQAVSFDDNASFLQYLQRCVNGFLFYTALLCDQAPRRKAAVILIVLVTDKTGEDG